MDILVSVIIPTRNRAQLLKRAIQSVYKQTLRDFELIVINDASTDDTLQLLKEFPNIRVINNTQPLGGSQARNLGVNISRGQWIAFLDDDDVWHPEKLAKQLNLLTENANAVACSAGYRVNYPFGIKRNVFPPKEINVETLLQSNSLGGSSVCMCNANILRNLGGFDRRLRSAQDWDVWVKLAMQGKIVSVPSVLIDYFVHFAYRISNDMSAKYVGTRRFYFKYKSSMTRSVQKNHLAFICFIKSRQSKIKMRKRLRYLFMANKNSTTRVGFSYIVSSFPRIILEGLHNTLIKRKRSMT